MTDRTRHFIQEIIWALVVAAGTSVGTAYGMLAGFGQ
jgi:hypothetical protein